MALVVNITGGEDIDQGDRVTLSATVEDANGNTPLGTLQYEWSASRGSFIGATDKATVVYHADFTDTNAVPVTITCNVTRPANAAPTSSGPSLTALAEIGVTGIIVNMFMTALGAVSPNTNTVLFNNTTGTLDSDSDQRLSSNVFVWQLRWDNQTGFNHFVLNNNESGVIGDFFRNNNNQSVYIIFDNGSYVELTPTDFANANSAGGTWARWEVTDTAILALLNALSATDDLVVGVADTDSIGWDADSGSDTETFSAAVLPPLSIESIDEQFVPLGTTDYDLVIDIAGKPDTVEASGHMEGFAQHWDAVNGQLHIRSKEVTRLISGVFWTIKITKGTQTLTADIAYNVVEAAPIFQTLVMLHLYRDVPINIDILIQNIPNLIVPNAKLLGLKSTLQDYGLNIGGELAADANFSVNEGDISVIVPSETGGTSEMHDYAYQIESGSPPAIGTPVFTAKGGHGTLEFTDVTHALGYEWTVQEGDADRVDWRVFDSTRALIDPGKVEVTPGQLQVTIKFPNIAGASAYEYRLESDAHEVDWKRFTGMLANGMITTIIPDLEEGVEYTLRLRVASPWVGTPVSIKVYGGRMCYTLHIDGAAANVHYLYIFHTGHQSGSQIPRIKRLLLPTSLSDPDNGGLAVNANGDVFIANLVGLTGEKALYTFLAATIDRAADESRLVQDRKNPFPSDMPAAGGNMTFSGIGEFDGDLYTYVRSGGRDASGIQVLSIPTTDGTQLTRTTSESHTYSTLSPRHFGLSVVADRVWYRAVRGGHVTVHGINSADREDFMFSTTPVFYANSSGNIIEPGWGLKVIDNTFYDVFKTPHTDLFRIFKRRPDVHATHYIEDVRFTLPIGLTEPRFLDILV